MHIGLTNGRALLFHLSGRRRQISKASVAHAERGKRVFIK